MTASWHQRAQSYYCHCLGFLREIRSCRHSLRQRGLRAPFRSRDPTPRRSAVHNRTVVNGRTALTPAIAAIKVVCGELPTVWGIRTQVDQVLSNLVGNAVKYLGDTSEGRVEVGAIDRGTFVECYVRDNGIGIDPAYHERIFEVFQRLKDVNVDGTGVGLAIVKRIIQTHGGRIWVESAKGQGATFWFTWPKPTVGDPSRERASGN